MRSSSTTPELGKIFNFVTSGSSTSKATRSFKVVAGKEASQKKAGKVHHVVKQSTVFGPPNQRKSVKLLPAVHDNNFDLVERYTFDSH